MAFPVSIQLQKFMLENGMRTLLFGLLFGEIVEQGNNKMTKQEAVKIVEDMPEKEFQDFLKSLPMRTQLCVKGGLVDWRECLAEWYIKIKGGNRVSVFQSKQ